MNIRIPVLFIMVILLCSCSKEMAGLEADANDLCNIYEPANLQTLKSHDTLKTFDAVNKQIRQTIKSDTFKDIFNKLAEQAPTDFYGELKKAISAKLGKPWECENAKAFYAIEWQNISSDIAKVTIKIRVQDGNTFIINNQTYPMSQTDKISEAISNISNGHEYNIQLYIPAATQKDKLNIYLDPLRAIGVKRLSIIEDKL